jgi:biopolymer transport protein ExbD
MNFRGRSANREDPEMNMVPMIDVMMVIIIFLMLTTTYSKFAELQINLPTADAQKQQERSNEIVVAVTAQGQYQINRRALSFTSMAVLVEEMRRAGEGMKEPVVLINADNNATHQAVVRLMDAARQAGYGQVAFAVEQGGAQ